MEVVTSYAPGFIDPGLWHFSSAFPDRTTQLTSLGTYLEEGSEKEDIVELDNNDELDELDELINEIFEQVDIKTA